MTRQVRVIIGGLVIYSRCIFIGTKGVLIIQDSTPFYFYLINYS